jgi:hypothetical protein
VVNEQYTRGAPKTANKFKHDTSKEKDPFGKGRIVEESAAEPAAKKQLLPTICTSVTSPSEPAPPYSLHASTHANPPTAISLPPLHEDPPPCLLARIYHPAMVLVRPAFLEQACANLLY